jgi:hypothetical protein
MITELLEHLASTSKWADEGSVDKVLENLDVARKYATDNGHEIAESTLTQIEENAYRNGVGRSLELAGINAGAVGATAGRVEAVDHLIKLAGEYAARVGTEVPKSRVDEIRKIVDSELSAIRNG